MVAVFTFQRQRNPWLTFLLAQVPLLHPLASQAIHRVSPCISWRGDCEYFAIVGEEEEDPADQQAINNSCSKKCVRVYSKEGLAAHAVGRHEDDSPVLGLGSALAWSTDGSLIAAVQETKRKLQVMGLPPADPPFKRVPIHVHYTDPTCTSTSYFFSDQWLQVVFFERNGLRHREFALRDMDPSLDSVDFLSWNVESTILAVGINTRQEGGGRIQLWHRNNYHWYMKYEEQVCAGSKIAFLQFDNEKANRLHVILSSSSSGTWGVYDSRL